MSLSSIGPLFGAFSRVINENDGTASVCVTFMEDRTVMVQGMLTTANSTAIGIEYCICILITLSRYVFYFLSLSLPYLPILSLSVSVFFFSLSRHLLITLNPYASHILSLQLVLTMNNLMRYFQFKVEKRNAMIS